MGSPEKREIMQHARELHFGGLEPRGGHIAGTSISSQTVLSRPAGGVNMLLIQSLDQDTYYTLDGTTPIGTGSVVGFLLKADDPPIAIPVGLSTIVTVVEGAATARLQYQWSK